MEAGTLPTNWGFTPRGCVPMAILKPSGADSLTPSSQEKPAGGGTGGLLPANSIGSWQDLRTRFAAQFLGGRRHLKNPTYLSRIKQRDGESLQAWLQRFTKATIEVGHLSDDALLLAASSAVREDTPFAFSIGKKPPRTYADFLGRARNYVNAEAATSKKSGTSKNPRGSPEGDRR